MKQTYSLKIEFKENDGQETYDIAGDLTFLETKTIISQGMCGGPENIQLWWMGEEIDNTMRFKEFLGDKTTVTLHCERVKVNG